MNKRAEYRDYVMEVLGQHDFFGVYMRIQFWINKILRSLTEERKTDCEDKDIDFLLTGVQRVIMKNAILYLLHQRDSVDRLNTLDIYNKNDFEWQCKLRVTWTDKDPENPLLTTEGPVVSCGGWSQQLGTEYLGSDKRMPLTPQSDRYVVFMSSALREKSGVLFKTNGSHTHAGDVFEEMANLCHMAYKSFLCN